MRSILKYQKNDYMNNKEIIEQIEMLLTLHDQNPEIECSETLDKISIILCKHSKRKCELNRLIEYLDYLKNRCQDTEEEREEIAKTEDKINGLKNDGYIADETEAKK